MPVWIVWLWLLLTLGTPGIPFVTLPDQRLRDDLVALALDPGPGPAAPLPFAGMVRLGLGPDLLIARERSALTARSAWRLDPPGGIYRASAGPFSALETHAAHSRSTGRPPSAAFSVTAGDHDDCFGRPAARPAGLTTHRRVSLQPAAGTIGSCLDWFSVDVYLRHGAVSAVTLDIGEP